jgi:hypothetical protein
MMPKRPDTDGFLFPHLVEMIDCRHPLVVLASCLSWAHIESTLAPYFTRPVRAGRVLEHDDLFGPAFRSLAPVLR